MQPSRRSDLSHCRLERRRAAAAQMLHAESEWAKKRDRGRKEGRLLPLLFAFALTLSWHLAGPNVPLWKPIRPLARSPQDPTSISLTTESSSWRIIRLATSWCMCRLERLGTESNLIFLKFHSMLAGCNHYVPHRSSSSSIFSSYSFAHSFPERRVKPLTEISQPDGG